MGRISLNGILLLRELCSTKVNKILLALNQAKARLRIQPDSIDKITNEDIHNIRALYSTYLLKS